MNVYLDLDRTLFDTDQGNKVIWNALAALPEADGEREFDRQQEFYVHQDDGRTYYYDFATHIRSLSLSLSDVETYLVEHAASDTLLLPGAVELLAQLRAANIQPEILTYGEDFYQRLKVGLCPSLSGMTVHTTLKAKDAFLKDKRGSLLVDDKPIGDQLPPHVAFIQVQLEETKNIPEGVAWPVYTELASVADDIIRRVVQ